MDTWIAANHTCPMITATLLVDEARLMVMQRVPYRHQGRTKTGLDCLGMVLHILEKHDVVPKNFERRNYSRLPMNELLDRMTLHCERTDTLVAGCALLIQFPSQRRPSHLALYTADQTIIHSYGVVKRVVEHGYRTPWPEITNSYWKLPGVTYG
jgi:cell wall-associated NlpC family hydrolase